MQFIRGNLALKNHLQNGKRVFLFEFARKGFVKFITELEFFDVGIEQSTDKNGDTRDAIKFFFKRRGAFIPVAPGDFIQTNSDDPESKYNIDRLPNTTEREGLIISRVGQGIYRKRVIHRWNYACAVTGFDKLEILIASHIVPWKDATNNERLDPNNGILLSPTYDALFDRHLISFENNGRIFLSEKIEIAAFEKIGLTGKEKIKKLSQQNLSYLEKHQAIFYCFSSPTFVP